MTSATPETRLVVFCPGVAGNPYLDSLGAAMEPLGWRATPAPQTTWLLFRCAEARKADVIHLHWPDVYILGQTWLKSFLKSLAFLAQLWWSRLAGKKIVWTCHNLRSHEVRFPKLQAWVSRRLLSICHTALAHSPACVDAVVAEHGEKFRHKLKSIRHANYLRDYPQGVSPEDARQRLGVEGGTFVFLFVGSIRGYKGIDVLLDDFGKIDLASTRLIIAGKPRDKAIDDRITSLSAKNPRVNYRNTFVPEEEMQVYMAAADVVVIPYRNILTSGTLLLAASFGKVAIVPDAPTLLDTVPLEGVIPFDRERESSLVEAMEAAVACRQDLSQRGAASRAFVERWGWEQMAAATIDAYNART